MKELVEVIAKSLVDYPDQVVVTETENEKAIVLELRVAQSDMGKVIGQTGTHCQGNPFCCEGCCLKGREESYCRDHAVTGQRSCRAR